MAGREARRVFVIGREAGGRRRGRRSEKKGERRRVREAREIDVRARERMDGRYTHTQKEESKKTVRKYK